MTITNAAQAIQEINSTNLVDGQAIKQLLLDLTVFLESAASPGNATTTVAGVVKQATDVGALSSVGPGVANSLLADVGTAFSQTTLNANFATLGTLLNAILTNVKAAGQMA